jgi:hypothetical protein
MHGRSTIHNVLTDTIKFSSSYEKSKDSDNIHLLFIFINGNPGCFEPYINFLDIVHNNLLKSTASTDYLSITTHSCSHANHHLKNENDENNADDEIYDFEFQINHIISYLESIIEFQTSINEKNEEIEIVLVGHSIGCYMILESLKRYEKLRNLTSNLVLMMPFIKYSSMNIFHRISLSLTLKMYSYSYIHSNIESLIVFLIKSFNSLNNKWRNLLLWYTLGFKDSLLKNFSDRFFIKRIILNILNMGITEIETVKSNERKMIEYIKWLDYEDMKILMIYTNNDKWASEKDVIFFQNILVKGKQYYGKARALFHHGLTHSFCLLENKTNIMTEIIKKNLIVGKSRNERPRDLNSIKNIDEKKIIKEEVILINKNNFKISYNYHLFCWPAIFFVLPNINKICKI